jgi:phosphopantothenoylcysteine decarboxylase/phosphopantothenate--cysteine ligase
MRVLVTAGGTEEPLDGVRRLTNVSTGATGGALASALSERGAEVLLLHAERAAASRLAVERESFVTFADLERLLRRHLAARDWDAVIHLAAVSDYHVDSIEVDGRVVEPGGSGKIGTGREVVIRLAPNPKLIDSLRSWSRNSQITVVGFKLTDDPDAESRLRQVRALVDRGVADLVVHNDIREIDSECHLATIYRGETVVARTASKAELAAELWRQIEGGGP